MTSRNQELNKALEELKHLSFKRQQLLERKRVQCIFQELRDRPGFKQAGEAAATDRVILASTRMERQCWANSLCVFKDASASQQHEIDSIDGQLSQLTVKVAGLKERIQSLDAPKGKSTAAGEADATAGTTAAPPTGFSSSLEASLPSAPPNPAAVSVVYVEPPPPFPGKTKN